MLVILLLSGFGLWQCGMGMTASPVVPMSHHHSGPLTTGHEGEPDSPMPTGLVALCLTMMVCVIAAFTPVVSRSRTRFLVRGLGRLPCRPVDVAARAPALAQLCVAHVGGDRLHQSIIIDVLWFLPLRKV